MPDVAVTGGLDGVVADWVDVLVDNDLDVDVSPEVAVLVGLIVVLPVGLAVDVPVDLDVLGFVVAAELGVGAVDVVCAAGVDVRLG